MTVGSPALAAYSLIITARNIRMVKKKAAATGHKAGQDVAKMLIALQQYPHKLTEDERILSAIREDGELRKQMVEQLGKKNSWSFTTTTNVLWVVVAFSFTFVDSFVSASGFSTSGSDGLAVGTLWIWLLCLVGGWLWVPVYSSKEIRKSIRRLNKETKEYIEKKFGGPIPPAPAGSQQKPSPAARHGTNEIQNEDRSSTNVGRLAIEQPDAAISATSSDREKGKLIIDIPPTKSGWLSDEARHPPMFNYSTIVQYHLFVDTVIDILHQAEIRDQVGVSGKCPMMEIILPVFNRNRGPSPGIQARNRSLTSRPFPLPPRRDCFLGGRNGR